MLHRGRYIIYDLVRMTVREDKTILRLLVRANLPSTRLAGKCHGQISMYSTVPLLCLPRSACPLKMQKSGIDVFCLFYQRPKHGRSRRNSGEGGKAC